VFQLSLSLFLFVSIPTVLCPPVSRLHLFLLRSPSASRAACTHTYVHTYLPTFNDRYAFNCSPSPSPRSRGRARLSDEPSHSFRDDIFRGALSAYVTLRIARERQNCNVTQRGVSRRRRYRDVAMRRTAPRCRSAGVAPSLSLSLSLSLFLSLRTTLATCTSSPRAPSYAYIQSNANGACRRALNICLTRKLCVGCQENPSKDLHLSSRRM